MISAGPILKFARLGIGKLIQLECRSCGISDNMKMFAENHSALLKLSSMLRCRC